MTMGSLPHSGDGGSWSQPACLSLIIVYAPPEGAEEHSQAIATPGIHDSGVVVCLDHPLQTPKPNPVRSQALIERCLELVGEG